jgi:hypothetical protein
MNEAEWNSCRDPQAMLEFMRDSVGKVSDRKLRLFAVACCRCIWPKLTDARCRSAVEIAERFADGLVATRDRGRAFTAAREATRHVGAPTQNAFHAAAYSAHASPVTAALGASANALYARGRWAVGPHGPVFRRWKGAPLCSVLRDIFDTLPFRKVHIEPAWLRWNDGTVPRLATAIYEGRSLSSGTLGSARLAVLADALEEAGCSNQDLLSHCRSDGTHVRGCWAVDLILGKQ